MRQARGWLDCDRRAKSDDGLVEAAGLEIDPPRAEIDRERERVLLLSQPDLHHGLIGPARRGQQHAVGRASIARAPPETERPFQRFLRPDPTPLPSNTNPAN